MAAISARAWQQVKPHVPLIKFRKGGTNVTVPSPSATPSAPSRPPPGTKPQLTPIVSLPLIEDWQLPKKYQRLRLDDAEINYINRGGPE